jgi:hypothetical protein
VTSASQADQLAALRGRDVFDPSGDKIGTVGQIYTDHTGQAAWASVHTGLFGMKHSLVPLNGANADGDTLKVAYDKATVKDAPQIGGGEDEPLAGEEVRNLYQFYNLGWDTSGTEDYTEGYSAGAAQTREQFAGDDPVRATAPVPGEDVPGDDPLAERDRMAGGASLPPREE